MQFRTAYLVVTSTSIIPWIGFEELEFVDPFQSIHDFEGLNKIPSDPPLFQTVQPGEK